jgi:hypothetical protein
MNSAKHFVSLSIVCRDWYRTLIDDGSFSSTIHVGSFRAVQELLQRSKGAALSIVIKRNHAGVNREKGIFQETAMHSDRICELYVSAGGDYLYGHEYFFSHRFPIFPSITAMKNSRTISRDSIHPTSGIWLSNIPILTGRK